MKKNKNEHPQGIPAYEKMGEEREGSVQGVSWLPLSALTRDVYEDMLHVAESVYEGWAARVDFPECGDDEILLLKAGDKTVGYASLSRGEKYIADVAVLPQHLRHAPKLLQELVTLMAQEGGQWHAEARESTSMKILERKGAQFGVEYKEHGDTGYEVNGDTVTQITMHVPDPQATLARMEQQSLAPRGVNNAHIAAREQAPEHSNHVR